MTELPEHLWALLSGASDCELAVGQGDMTRLDGAIAAWRELLAHPEARQLPPQVIKLAETSLGPSLLRKHRLSHVPEVLPEAIALHVRWIPSVRGDDRLTLVDNVLLAAQDLHSAENGYGALRVLDVLQLVSKRTRGDRTQALAAHPEVTGEAALDLLDRVGDLLDELVGDCPPLRRRLAGLRKLALSAPKTPLAKSTFTEHGLVAVPDAINLILAGERAYAALRTVTDPTDLDPVIDAYAVAVGHPQFAFLPSAFRNLLGAKIGAAKLRRHEVSADPADLDEAIELLRCAETLDAADKDARVAKANLALALERRGTPADLRAALTSRLILVQAAGGDPDEQETHVMALSDCGIQFRELAQYTGDRQAVEEAILAHTTAMTACPLGSPLRAGCEVNLANDHRIRFHQSRDPADFLKALGHAESAERAADRDDALAVTRHNLGAFLRGGHDLGILPDALGRALDLHEWSLAHTPQDSASWPVHAVGLAGALYDLFTRTHELRLLDRAIALCGQAVAALPESADRTDILVTAANLHHARFRQLGHPEDAEAGGALARRAMQVTDPAANAFPLALVALVDAQPETADARTLLAGSTEGPYQAAVLDRLAGSHYEAFAETLDLREIDQAIAAYRQAEASLAADSPVRVGFLTQLAVALAARNLRDGGTSAQEALRVLEQACALGHDRPPVLVKAASLRGQLRMQQQEWVRAAVAYTEAIQAAQEIYRVQLADSHRHQVLTELSGLPAEAAYAAVRAGDIEGAVLMLEHGRALLFAETSGELERRLTELSRAGHDDLAAAYRSAAADLRTDVLPASAIIAARARLDAVVERIRLVNGFADFQQPIDLAGVRAAAPLVYLAAATPEGVLIFVPPDGPPEAVVLPLLTREAVDERVRTGLAAQARIRATGQTLDWSRHLDDITRWLWSACMEQVVSTVGGRATLVPCGLLGLLPLHCAWTPDSTRESGRRYALDDALLTFAPNARMLRTERPPGGEGVLAVAEPATRGQPALPHAMAECRAAVAAVPRSRVLTGLDADRATVLDGVTRAAVVHVACHGRAVVDEPLESGLLLAGTDRLTVRDLLGLNIPADLVVLSACDTALAGRDLPDEAQSLPTALLQAGAGAVIGSLWAIPDASTMRLMTGFYQLYHAGTPPAEALREAQRRLRDTPGYSHPLYWGAFFYSGR
ncbi:tetratricopeptide (TPR) repeat protein [Streptomyces glaucescens]